MALEREIGDRAALAATYLDGQLVAAKRIVAMGARCRRFQFPEIPRRAAMVEDNLLIKLAQIVAHDPKISRTWPNASTSASISLRLL